MGKKQKVASDGRAKDMILEYALNSSNFGLDILKRDLFPNKELEDIRVLLKEIESSEHKTISLKIGDNYAYLLSKGTAKTFLKTNSFEKIENKLKEEERKYRYDYLFSKYRYWTYWIVFSLGLFGGLYSNLRCVYKIPTQRRKIKENRTKYTRK